MRLALPHSWAEVGDMAKTVAANVEAHTISDCGHVLPHGCADGALRHVLAMAVSVRA